MRFGAFSRLLAVVAFGGAVCVGGTASASTQAAKPQQGGTLILLKNADQGLGWDPGQFQGVPSTTEDPGVVALYDTLFYEDAASLKLMPRIGLSLTALTAAMILSESGANWSSITSTPSGPTHTPMFPPAPCSM